MTYAYNQVPEPESTPVSTDSTLVKAHHPAVGDAWVPRSALSQMGSDWQVVETDTTTTTTEAPPPDTNAGEPATDEGSETV